MNRHDIEQKLPAMTQAQRVDKVKTCLDMIERLENDLAVGARTRIDDPRCANHPVEGGSDRMTDH